MSKGDSHSVERATIDALLVPGLATHSRSCVRPRRLRALLAATSIAAALSACGGGGGGSGAAVPPPPSPPPSPPAAYSVSGTVAAADISLVDSDTNDPDQQGRASNNALANAQIASNPALVVGYVNLPSTGATGANFTAGDRWDIYRVDLVAGQVVELNFGDSTRADLDLFIGDLAGNILGQSIGVSRSECVRITRTATYTVGVYAFSGASSYEVAWGPPSPGSFCASTASSFDGAASFVPGQLIAKPRTASGTGADVKAMRTITTAQVSIKSGPEAGGGAMLIELPSSSAQRALTMSALSAAATPTGKKSIAHAAMLGSSEQGRLAFETAIASKQLFASGGFEYVELNTYAEALQAAYVPWPPNDANLPRQPHLGLIRLPDAFDALSSFSPRPTYTPIVAVVDSGIVADHPDLQRMLVPGYDFVADPANAGDGDGIDTNPDDPGRSSTTGAASFHGTHVAGTVAAEAFNGQGVVGVATMARIMPVRVLGVTGRGTGWDIVQGIRFAARLSNASGTLPARRADVINLSLGGQGTCPSIYADAIAAARSQGSIVVAAAGNDSGAPVSTPANCSGVIAVSAISYDGRLASYSNYGPQIAVAAPGGDTSRVSPAGQDLIFSTSATFMLNAQGLPTRTPNYFGNQGTSMATPHVAGVLALMRAVNPALTPADFDSLFAAGALTNDLGASGRDVFFGYGLIDALKAVQAAATTAGGTITVLPTLELTPAVLDFGPTMTELSITIRRVNNSTDTPAQYVTSALNPAAISFSNPPSGNPASGPYTYLVGINRALLTPGENVIRVEIISAQNRRLPFDVAVAPRPVAPVANRGVGPVYVIAVNVEQITNAGQADVTSTTPTYSYTINGITAPRVVIVAGTDTDNDGYICGASEPCGMYPLLGADPTVLEMNSNKTAINFALISSGASAASLGAGPKPLLPAAGIARRGR